jgi:DNA-binding transcriptional LysR family regulator
MTQLTHRQLSLFRATMLHGNLSRAAEVTGSSQPTLSRELARLEQLLGFPLFDRVSGRLRPTARAMALMQEVERSFIGLEQIATRAEELRWQSGERLRLACLPALAHSLAPRVLRCLGQRTPDIQVSVDPLESPWLEQAMAEQRFDAGLSETTQAPLGTKLSPLLEINEVAVLSAKHPLCRKKKLTPEDFAGQRFISLAPGDPYRVTIDKMFDDAGVQRVLAYETASAVAVCAMVQEGLGVAIVNPLTALALQGPTLVMRPLSVAIAFKVSLILPQLTTPHPMLEALQDAIQTAVGEIN